MKMNKCVKRHHRAKQTHRQTDWSDICRSQRSEINEPMGKLDHQTKVTQQEYLEFDHEQRDDDHEHEGAVVERPVPNG